MAKAGTAAIIGAMAMTILAGWPVGARAGAQPPNASDRAALARFKTLDRQADLSLSPDELAPARAARPLFAILDRSNDNTLTAADGAPARHLLYRLGLRKMSRSQFTSLTMPRIVAALDTDGDGRLSMAELRPSLAGNAPLATAAPPLSPPDIVDRQPRPQPCWYFDGNRWVELPATTPTCRMR